MGGLPRPTRAEILAIYRAGPEAVVQVVEAWWERMAGLEARVQALEDRLAQDSRNSSKPPSSDLGRSRPTPRSLRPGPGETGRRAGGQPGHPGTTLRLVDTPDRLEFHRPPRCAGCGQPLPVADPAGGPAAGGRLDRERRQVVDVPPPRPEVVEHRVVHVTCAACGAETAGAFPVGVAQPAQYGERIKAVAVYLHDYQLVPDARTQEVLADLFGVAPAEGTLQAAETACFERLAATEAAIRQAIQRAAVAHFDETSGRVRRQRDWLHVASTATLTYYGVHPRRGTGALDALGVLPGFTGTAVHDAYASYLTYTDCAHALCNAHLLRELIFLHEQHRQAWADELATLLVAAKELADAARAAGHDRLDPVTVATVDAHYDHLLWQGRRANPPLPTAAARPEVAPARGRKQQTRARGRKQQTRARGRKQQTRAQNLLDRLVTRRAAVLAFVHDLRVPFDNNQAERDLRMLKVHQKISGGFRTVAGAAAFARIRGYISTVRKQGLPVLAALEGAFAGAPPMPSLAG